MKVNSCNYPESITEKESRRFWSKVNKDGPILKEELGQCWEWTAGKSGMLYGGFQLRNKYIYSHRLSYIVTKGLISDELVLDHLCENKICVNPNHLMPVTDGENIRRGNAGINQTIKTQCPRGHLLEGNNLVNASIKKGQRVCKSCHRAQSKYNNAKSRNGIILDPNLFKQVADEYYREIVNNV